VKTEAQKQFDADYLIRRRLFMMCDSETGSANKMKSWLRLRAAKVIVESNREIKSGKYDNLIGSPSVVEIQERKYLKNLFEDDDD
jgi:hypothetical protein